MARPSIKSSGRPEAKPVPEADFVVHPLPSSRWHVAIPWAGEAVVVADDKAGAIAAFNAACGVGESIHKHSVTLLD